MALETINPSTGQVVERYQEMSDTEVEEAIAAAHEAHLSWRRLDLSARARVLRLAASRLAAEGETHARRMVVEMGKPLVQARAEVDKCVRSLETIAAAGPSYLQPRPVETEARRAYYVPEPLGVILGIMPWNFPYWQVIRFAAPALLAGNTVLLKHAANVTGSGLALEEVFALPAPSAGIFRTLRIGSGRVAQWIGDGRIQGVSLTGSTPAGRAVAAQAGQALKKTVLELGGSDPYLVLEDADLEAAARACAHARLVNSGQSCIAAKRFIVHRAVLHPFEELLVQEMRAATLGDPMSEETRIGPLARQDLREGLHQQVSRSVELGARLLLGGDMQPGPGYFYPATVLTGVRAGMPAADEELFGPVAAVLAASTEDEAIGLANASTFGLGAAVFTADRDRGERVARRLEAGSCFVNDFVRSDARLPFGGVKESGYGRELGPPGYLEFTNLKTVWIA